MHPMFAALALHSQTVSLLAHHHPHKHTASYYAHQASQAFASIGKDGGPFHEGDLAIVAVIVILAIVVSRLRRGRRSGD